ncbi:MAG: PEP-CTERM sorting domain-containing protein [Gemmatimonadota bacterium]|nr:PEP-CTERM sorting domain-containing protein [Gemmatimonadota bacterium]
MKSARSIARTAAILSVCATLVGTVAGAQPVAWTNWTSFTAGTPGSATGTIAASGGPATVTYTGEVLAGSQTSAGGITYFDPNSSGHNFSTTTYSNGTTVPNGPGTNPGFIQMQGGGNTILNTLTFSTPVNKLFFAIISLGQPGNGVTYAFNNAFTIATQGGGWWGTCGSPPCLTQSGNNLTGIEGDGTLIFNGPITSISWTAAPSEYWHGFSVGAPSTVPEPSSMALLGTGLVGLVPMMRRRRKK